MEETPFNLSDSIEVQMSAENMNETNENISCNLHSSLTVLEVERDFEKNSIQWRKSRYCSIVYSTDNAKKKALVILGY